MTRILVIISVIVISISQQVWAAAVCLKNDCVQVEVVTEEKDMRRGLQGREGLADKRGMLFVFRNDAILSFWMKDMKFAIDMVWIDSSRRIVTIAPSRPPCVKEPCEVYASKTNARYVLELPSGYALKHHFQEGDGLLFKDINLE